MAPKPRTQLAHRLLSYFSKGRYLEIGIRRGDNLSRVHAPCRTGVDPNPRTSELRRHLKPHLKHLTIHKETSDEFFIKNTEEFDVIFIDGLHLYEQVLKDVSNALSCLAPHGFIMMHDCLPETAHSATREFHEGIWNGDVWKAMYQIQRDLPQLFHAVVDTDWGLGLLWRKDPDETTPVRLRAEQAIMDLTFDDFLRFKETFNIVAPADLEKILVESPAHKRHIAKYTSPSRPLVSIFIPTYNQAEFICQAVDSALSQTYESLEVVVCNDNSTDNTDKLLGKYAGNPRIRIVNNAQNLGRVRTYRKGLFELVKGEWTLNLDGDDFIHDETWVQRAMERIQSDPEIVMACAKKQTLYRDGTVKIGEQNLNLPEIMDGFDAFWALHDCSFSAPHCTAIYNSKKGRELGFYSHDIVNTDLESTYRLLLTGRIAVFPDIVSSWRMHENNASLYQSAEDRVDNLLCYTSPYDFARQSDMDPSKCREWLQAHLDVACTDAYGLLKYSGDNRGYATHLMAVKTISSNAFWRNAVKPKFLLKLIAVSLGMARQKKPHWLR